MGAGVTDDRSRNSEDLIELRQPVLDRFRGPGLQLRVQGGEDFQSRMVDDLAAVALLEILQCEVEEVAARRLEDPRRPQVQPRLKGLFGFISGDVTDRRHACQNHLLALPGALEVAQWIVAGRGFRQSG